MPSWRLWRRWPWLVSWRYGPRFFIVGYALMLQSTTHNFASALAQASGALFTVGTIDLSGRANFAVDIAAGATWVVIVALQIAYLPALYQAFNRRETLVAMLESRAGVPAWGPELLARHQLVGIIDSLPQLYSDWEQWSAELAESHTTYPVMLLFRSPDPWFSWLLGLLAVLDGAAMHLALAPENRLFAVEAVPANGLHLPQSHRQGLGVEGRPRPQSGGTDRPDVRGIRRSSFHA